MLHITKPLSAALTVCSSCFLLLLLLLLRNSEAAVYSNLWAVHIKGGERAARAIAEKHGFVFVDKIMEDHYTFQEHSVARRSAETSTHHHNLLDADPEVIWFEQQEVRRRVKRDIAFDDVKWRMQWYLDRRNQDKRMLDMNVAAAWKKGYTGKGIVVTILDDGIEKTHPDLEMNYDARASRDVNGGDDDPTPRYELTNENRHGTRCAGEVAAVGNNTICGVGVAFEARIGGIRMLDGDVSDSVEAASLSYNRDHIDIYSASWGPEDDGRTVDGPASLARKAFRDGIVQGRDGKGSIFVWASGNGGSDDSCNCDGYTNSIYTLSISSATENGNVPWYSEACSSTMATTYSSGAPHERQIVTTDIRKGCTESHTGTSASAPLAAGIVALALQANPNLTWRDMQYLVVLSANPNYLEADDWLVNGVGRRVSHHFGYGMMNAGKMVDLAVNWTNVSPQRTCEVVSPHKNVVIPPQDTVSIKLVTNACEGTVHQVVYLEHVQAKISLSSSYRGDIQVFLTSPMGTRSTLLASRSKDNSVVGFNEWAFMTTHSWGEMSRGEWTLEIRNGYKASSTLREFALILHGTQENPLESAAVFNKAVLGLDCTAGMFHYRGECVDQCPHGWFSAKGRCLSCHMSCASCDTADNTSCTECYHGSYLLEGSCLPIEIYKAKTASSAKEQGLNSKSSWWLLVGVIVAIVVLLTVLVVLAVYYAYTLGYMTNGKIKRRTEASNSSCSSSTNSGHAGPEQLIISQHSSQQELMSSDDEDTGKLEGHRMV